VVRNEKGELVAMNRMGYIRIVDEKGRERERYQVAYGARADQRRRCREALSPPNTLDAGTPHCP
jgi:hypothetical protein